MGVHLCLKADFLKKFLGRFVFPLQYEDSGGGGGGVKMWYVANDDVDVAVPDAT